jgi:hypothetical protein
VGDGGEGESVADARIGLEVVPPAALYRRLLGLGFEETG